MESSIISSGGHKKMDYFMGVLGYLSILHILLWPLFSQEQTLDSIARTASTLMWIEYLGFFGSVLVISQGIRNIKVVIPLIVVAFFVAGISYAESNFMLFVVFIIGLIVKSFSFSDSKKSYQLKLLLIRFVALVFFMFIFPFIILIPIALVAFALGYQIPTSDGESLHGLYAMIPFYVSMIALDSIIYFRKSKWLARLLERA